MKLRGFLDFRTVKDKILFLDSKTTPRTFNALEAKLGTKNQKKKIQSSFYREQLHDSRKIKRKLKVKDGLPLNKRFLSLF